MNPARSETERNPAIQAAVNERAKLNAEMDKLFAEGKRLCAEGDDLYAEGDVLAGKAVRALRNSVHKALGDGAEILWYDHPIINGVTYTPEPAP